MPRVAIIDYGSGNLRSAEKAFSRADTDLSVTHEIVVTDDPERVRTADRIVLPGVGAFADCRAGISTVPGLEEALLEAVVRRARPFLGICVGMQLMAREGLEHGRTEGFGWIPGVVRPIAPADPTLKVPHMGWNTLTVDRDHAVLSGIATGSDGLHAYFVHSYHLVADQPDHVIARTDHGGPVTAMVARDTMVGTQFHPEKSQALGQALIANFLCWTP